MEIEVESSSAATSDIGIDVNTTGATISKSLITSEIVIGDGQTGIIGGLIRESQNQERSQVPILGDIPLLGTLFRGKSSGRARQNLVILVTPRIINRDEDMQDITDERVQDYYSYDLDAIFEKGFIKKIKAKHKMRNEHRPSDTYKQKVGGAPSNNSRRGK